MVLDPKNWLAIEQQMEEVNHILLQIETLEEVSQEQPHLLMLSTHAAQGTSYAATFLVILCMGRKRGISLIDSGSTYTFLDYTFASKAKCSIKQTKSQKVSKSKSCWWRSS
jgi:predicted DNA-binding protein